MLDWNNKNCTFVFVSKVFSLLDFEFRKDDDDNIEKKKIELRGIEEEINWRSWVTKVTIVLFCRQCFTWEFKIFLACYR